MLISTLQIQETLVLSCTMHIIIAIQKFPVFLSDFSVSSLFTPLCVQKNFALNQIFF